ncbi:MAG TPA: AAA family ATPase [Solirubrobacteraceae bacterium]|nr:AAA family ATPase [Solirubrobacteraceae bacterium]
MRIRWLRIERFRGLREFEFVPTARTVFLGPNNAGKSTILEALDWLFYSGLGRPRPSPSEIDYFERNPGPGFSIEAVIGDLPGEFIADVREYLEGWKSEAEELVPEPDGDGIESVIRVRVRGTEDFDVLHEFAKEEAAGARFAPRHRSEIGWVFDGRTRDPVRQLSFYQGGLLERVFGGVDLDPAVATLKDALSQGAASVNADEAVSSVLAELADELRPVGLLQADELPQFEVGAVSVRELLQALRLALPGPGVQIPVFRQGRGAQRLLLVAILLRLAQAAGRPAIGGFEEPEEALEPLRQTQMARMLSRIAEDRGQIFVVTHSPEIARAFSIEDIVLLQERAAGAGACVLRKTLSVPVRQKYERWLDRAVVRALFARVPLLVEGPGDRAVVETFWQTLARRRDKPEGGGEQTDDAETSPVRPAEQLGVDIVNCEGAGEMPMMARLLTEAGKTVVAWVEQDVPSTIEDLRGQGNCAALVLHDDAPDRQNLEEALARSASMPALTKALDALAASRSYSWEKQRDYLVSTAERITQEEREAMKRAASLGELFAALDEGEARTLITQALAAKSVAPFEMKGARQGRIVAETIVELDGVPEPFARALHGLVAWIENGAPVGEEISMGT